MADFNFTRAECEQYIDKFRVDEILCDITPATNRASTGDEDVTHLSQITGGCHERIVYRPNVEKRVHVQRCETILNHG